MTRNRPWVLCLGEVVWDLFPQGPALGGAPFNVAVHLARQGVPVTLRSAVGRDALGAGIQEVLRAEGIPVVPEHPRLPTGTVDVVVDALGVPAFTIHGDGAWTDLEAAIPEEEPSTPPRVVVFGGLAQHPPGNRRVLKAILGRTWAQAGPAPLRLCDLNLRPGWSSPEVALACLDQADYLKLNADELAFVLELLGLEGEAGERALLERFQLQGLCITLGSQGLRWRDRQGLHLALPALEPPLAPPLVDTVGAGDAITAALAHGLAQGAAPARFLEAGLHAAARVCGVRGCLPPRAAADPTRPVPGSGSAS